MLESDQLETRDLLRFVTAGSVDDGKSTLIGRLLNDTGNLHDDQLQAMIRSGESEPDFSLATDGLEAEQAQRITIDVAYRYFSTARRAFILSDAPGHEQYTRNMATGASSAELALVLIDAENGVTTQTRRHAFIASLLGIPRLLIVVNKMDLVGWSETAFDRIRSEFTVFARRLPSIDLKFVPVCALDGDNIVEASPRTPWYRGETVLEYLENVYIGSDENLIDFRFPVQHVQKCEDGTRTLLGQITSGRIRCGEEVLVLPSRIRTRVRTLIECESEQEEVFASQSVSMVLEDPVDVQRGDMIVRPNNVPHTTTALEAMVVVLSDAGLDSQRPYRILQGCNDVRARVEEVRYSVDVNSLSRQSTDKLALNEIGRVAVRAYEPLHFDAYQTNPGTGRFVLVDEETNDTVAAGMVIDRLPENEPQTAPAEVHEDASLISREERESASGTRAVTLWFTGLSGAGKSTIARELERCLFDAGVAVYRIDGDNLRAGLTSDLGFSPEDRKENVRRVAEVARLFNDAGVLVLASLISPYEADRRQARQIIGNEQWIEVHVDAPLSICESRDPKGLYQKARDGELSGFTGVAAPYEAPTNPNLVVDTSNRSVEECVNEILAFLGYG